METLAYGDGSFAGDIANVHHAVRRCPSQLRIGRGDDGEAVRERIDGSLYLDEGIAAKSRIDLFEDAVVAPDVLLTGNVAKRLAGLFFGDITGLSADGADLGVTLFCTISIEHDPGINPSARECDGRVARA